MVGRKRGKIKMVTRCLVLTSELDEYIDEIASERESVNGRVISRSESLRFILLEHKKTKKHALGS